ncbi:MAG TPA: metalloregulator ArsR/SmtB family transcription factor [Kofleriaceae bacterium]
MARGLDYIAERQYSYVAMNNEARLSEVFFALADPTRRAILARLEKGEATVAELGAPFGLRQPTISKHLRILEDAGFIEQGRDAQRRPRRLVVGGPFQDIDRWLEPFRAQWERRTDRLESFLENRPKRAAGAAKKGPPR